MPTVETRGLRQRLAFGMALVGDPNLLLLDEPTAGPDPNGTQRIRETVRGQAANGTTVFFSSHVLGEVADVLGFAAAPNLYAFVNVTSPFVAYRKLLDLVFVWPGDGPIETNDPFDTSAFEMWEVAGQRAAPVGDYQSRSVLSVSCSDTCRAASSAGS